MKKKLSILIFLVAMITCLCVAPAYAIPTASLNLLDSGITVGESFDIEVWADGDNILNSFSAHDEMTSFAFEVTAGAGFFWDGYTIGHSDFDDDSVFFGPTYVAASADPLISDDDILLATLSFTALSVGTDTISVFGDASIFEGLGYLENCFFDIDTSIDVTVDTAPIPEPGTMLLFIFGLAGLGVFHRKKFMKL